MTYRLPSQLSGAPRRLLSRLASAIAVCLLIPASVAQDRTQRPLPLPDRTASVPAASQQLLQKLRQTIERQETAPVPPAALDQLGAMLKNLQDKLPPDLLPQGLGDVSPDAIQKSLQQPQTQQKLKELLQQFQEDGLLPPTSPQGTPQSPQLPLPTPQLTPNSADSLQDFLQELQQQAEKFQTPAPTPAPAQPTTPTPQQPEISPITPPGRTIRRRDNSGPQAPQPRGRLQSPRALPTPGSEMSPEIGRAHV